MQTHARSRGDFKQNKRNRARAQNNVVGILVSCSNLKIWRLLFPHRKKMDTREVVGAKNPRRDGT